MAPRARPSRFGAPVTWTLRVLGIILVVWLVASAVLVVRARSQVGDGLDRLDAARDRLSAAALLRGEGEAALAAAQDDFAGAHDSADNPLLAPWAAVPLVGGNVESIESLTQAATTVARTGKEAAKDSADAIAAPPANGTERLELLDRLEQTVSRARRQLRHLDLGPDFFLVGPLGDARDRFRERLEKLRTALDDARAVTLGARQLLAGPRKYVLVAANNAEMRAGSGMFLSVGVATFADGAFTIGDMRPSPDFNLPAGAVPLPPEYEKLWGWVRPSQEWRNLATSPRFDLTAPVAAQMWQAATGEQVDGVLAVDPVTLQALLAAQGPIDAGGKAISAENVLQFLLLDQYVGLSGDAEQIARRDQLSAVARAAVDTLESRPWKTAELVQQLADVGKGRHILAWARDPVEERAWKAAGIDGALGEESLAVSLINTGANKLDQFVHLDADLEVQDAAEGASEVTVTVWMSNEAPTGLPPYVGGPFGGTDLAEGEYLGILAVNAPGVGTSPQFEGSDPVLVAGLDGPTKVQAVGYVRLLRGEKRTLTVRFVMPRGFRAVDVEPSARVPPITWHFRNSTWQDTRTERKEW